MRILVLNYEFPPVGGGGGRVSRDVATALAARGHEVKLITSWHRGLALQEFVEGVDIRRIRCFRQHRDRCSVPEMACYVTAATPAAVHLARWWRPDVIHAHFAVPTGAVAYAVRRTIGTPYVLTAHLGDVPGGVPDQTEQLFRILNPVVRPIWDRASRITAVSTFVADLAKISYGKDARVLFNGVMAGEQAKGSSRRSSPRLIFVGRLNPQKNVPFLIEVLARIRHAAWSLDIVGDGPQREQIDEIIEQNGLRSRITLHGWQDDRAIDAYLAKADILAMPSLSEGFPVVGARALAAGLAIFGSTANGLDDIVVDGVNGVRVDPADIEGAARSLTALLSNLEKISDMSAASFERARLFDLSNIVDGYEALLAEAAQCG